VLIYFDDRNCIDLTIEEIWKRILNKLNEILEDYDAILQYSSLEWTMGVATDGTPTASACFKIKIRTDAAKFTNMRQKNKI